MNGYKIKFDKNFYYFPYLVYQDRKSKWYEASDWYIRIFGKEPMRVDSMDRDTWIYTKYKFTLFSDIYKIYKRNKALKEIKMWEEAASNTANDFLLPSYKPKMVFKSGYYDKKLNYYE